MAELYYPVSNMTEVDMTSALKVDPLAEAALPLFAPGSYSYSLTTDPVDLPKREAEDLGFGKHIREAVAIVKDWAK